MKVRVQNFFQDFYNSQVFHPVIAGDDLKWSYIDEVYDSIIEKDKAFHLVDKNIFRKEMMALRMEMIGLAFSHNIKNKELLLSQSLFTKKYLENNNEPELWDIMGEYNKGVAMSMDYSKNEREISLNNVRRASLYDGYVHNYPDMDKYCIARVCNRDGSEDAWKKQYTIMRLTARFCDRADCDEKIDETLTVVSSVIWGFYQGAKDAIKSVKFNG